MFCKKSFQSFVPTKREFRVSYQINSHFLRGLQAFSVLLPWISPSAGTPGRGSLAASGQTWPGSCCLTQRHQGSQVQQYNLSRLQQIALQLQVEQPASPKTQELVAPAKGVVQVWKVSFWTTKAKNFGLDSSVVTWQLQGGIKLCWKKPLS